MSGARLILKPGREKSVRQRHPWIFSGAVANVTGGPEAGQTVEVYDHGGSWLARAGFSPHSQIVGRIWTWDPDRNVDADFFRRGLSEAVCLRRPLEAHTDGIRLVNAENDGLPGIIVDRYADHLAVQFLSAPAEHWKKEVVEVLSGWEGVRGVYERSDADVREKEGLDASVGLLSGFEPPVRVPFHEENWKFLADIRGGHKTGFYLDQRESRGILNRIAVDYLRGGEVLNLFSYTGSFSVVALSAGADRVLNVDSSQTALRLAREQMSLNGIAVPEDSFMAGNAFEILRRFRDEGREFDAVILDPPKFATSHKDLRRATRAYKDINWLAMRILRPKGFLFTFSCSGLVDEDLFQKIVFSAALDAGRDAQIIRRCGQPLDHPVRLTFPEGRYLKGFVCRIGERWGRK